MDKRVKKILDKYSKNGKFDLDQLNEEEKDRLSDELDELELIMDKEKEEEEEYVAVAAVASQNFWKSFWGKKK